MVRGQAKVGGSHAAIIPMKPESQTHVYNVFDEVPAGAENFEL